MPRSAAKAKPTAKSRTGTKSGTTRSSGSKGLALITGASRGIGAELAKQFARGGYDLVLVARNAGQLLDLAALINEEHGRWATTVAADLGEPGAVQKLRRQLQEEGIEVDVLVNNAGLLDNGDFTDISLSDHLQLIELNIAALTALTHQFLGPMRQRGSGRILNVASLASFQPVPQLAVYAASKAYVLSLTEALSEELKGTGVTITALCPGFVRTGMTTGGTDGGDLHLPSVLMLSPEFVAQEGYKACMKGETIHVPGLGGRLVAGITELQPRAVRRVTSGLLGRMLLKK
ncbi:MAG: SDR family oxidoreductase [Halieaceae bacterium]|nr:SDR family oxidoreductase [Halieaceae bacterium]MCP5147718.1 SDR family oxidoreductase [Pseudomonadales bacterium]MCP5167429.1 SDR family oxidoreductase [Pseudomonadales bacterium]MCP5186996.1 SDR family oxidoreductase [Pseudomonadales bacterium]